MAGRFLFACRFAGRCGSVVLAAYRLAVSHHFHVSLLLPSGRFALPARRPPVFRASCLPRPRCHAVGGEVIGSSPLAPFVRYGERGAVGACACDGGWCYRVRSMWYHLGFVIAVGRAACLFVVVSSRPIVLVQCRIAWRGRLLEKNGGGLFAAPSHSLGCSRHFASPGCLSSSPNRSHISCGSRMYRLSPPPRHFAPGNRSRPAPRVEQDGEQDGDGFALCLICPSEM